jgi:Carboxypeptidase regulatory-like domain
VRSSNRHRRQVSGAVAFVILWCVGSLIAPSTGLAQTVEGQLVRAIDHQPVTGAFVVLVGANGLDGPGFMTGPDGRFLLTAPVAGTYRVRADIIGYRSTLSGPLSLTIGDTVSYQLKIAVQAVKLHALVVNAHNRCRAKAGAGEAILQLWNEIRKTLELTAWTSRHQALSYRLRLYTRELEPEHLRVKREVSSVLRTNETGSPFGSLSADSLSRYGYVRRRSGGGAIYYAPDADVLMSAAFSDAHCFQLEADTKAGSGLIGLAFRPLRSERPDIQGVLWVELSSGVLRELDYHYVHLPWPVADNVADGKVVFAHVPAGPSVVRRWYIRMPELGVRIQGSERHYQVLGIRERGGEVSDVRYAGQQVLSPTIAVVAGMIRDRTRDVPLAGAVVALEGTSYRTTTGTDGRFILRAAPGTYTLVFRHPRLLELPPAVDTSTVVRLVAGETDTLDINIPPLQDILAAACADTAAPDGGAVRLEPDNVHDHGALFGIVHGPKGQRTQAEIDLRWTAGDLNLPDSAAQRVGALRGRSIAGLDRDSTAVSVATRTLHADSVGRFWACQVPEGRSIQVIAQRDTLSSGVLETQLKGVNVIALDVTLDRKVTGTGDLLFRRGASDSVPVYALPPIEVEDGKTHINLPAMHSHSLEMTRLNIRDAEQRGARTLFDLLKRGAVGQLHVYEVAGVSSAKDPLDVRSGIGAGACVEDFRASSRPGNGSCQMVDLMLDGTLISGSEAASLIDSLDAEDIEEVEYFPPTEATFRFGTSEGRGVLLIRTRQGHDM